MFTNLVSNVDKAHLILQQIFKSKLLGLTVADLGIYFCFCVSFSFTSSNILFSKSSSSCHKDYHSDFLVFNLMIGDYNVIAIIIILYCLSLSCI